MSLDRQQSLNTQYMILFYNIPKNKKLKALALPLKSESRRNDGSDIFIGK